MTPVEFVAFTMSPPQPDGRYLFRPWGACGPCYLLSPAQRTARAKFQLGFYCALIALPNFVSSLMHPWQRLAAFGAVMLLINAVMLWCYTFNLPKVTPPPRPDRAQRQTARIAYAHALGRPLLWTFLIMSSVLVILGTIMAIVFHAWLVGLLCVAVFLPAIVTFAWQLRIAGARQH